MKNPKKITFTFIKLGIDNDPERAPSHHLLF